MITHLYHLNWGSSAVCKGSCQLPVWLTEQRRKWINGRGALPLNSPHAALSVRCHTHRRRRWQNWHLRSKRTNNCGYKRSLPASPLSLFPVLSLHSWSFWFLVIQRYHCLYWGKMKCAVIFIPVFVILFDEFSSNKISCSMKTVTCFYF